MVYSIEYGIIDQTGPFCQPQIAGCRGLCGVDGPATAEGAGPRPARLATRAQSRDSRSGGTLSPAGTSGDAASNRLAAPPRQFGLFVPRGYVARMRRGDPNDPLLRQVLPLGDELDRVGLHGRSGRRRRGPTLGRAAAQVRRPRAARSSPAPVRSIAATAFADTILTTKRRSRSPNGSRRSPRSRPTRRSTK